MKKVILSIVLIFFLTSCAGVPKTQTKGVDCVYSNEQKIWALATAGILTEMNRGRHDLLGGMLKNEKNTKIVKEKILKRWWGIGDRKKLFEILNWLEESGHRKRMYAEGQFLNKYDQIEFIEILKRYKDDKQMHQRLYEAYWGYRAYGETSVLAWDFCRYVALCGWGYVADYISEEEAWELIMPKAQELQKNYSSWGQMADNYLHGRAYWSWKKTVGSKRPGHWAWKQLEWEKTDSPWKVYDWNMDLSCKK
jgi:hypothetical protein